MAEELGWPQRAIQSHKRKPGRDMTQLISGIISTGCTMDRCLVIGPQVHGGKDK